MHERLSILSSALSNVKTAGGRNVGVVDGLEQQIQEQLDVSKVQVEILRQVQNLDVDLVTEEVLTALGNELMDISDVSCS